MSLPALYTPLTKTSLHWMTNQHSRCADFEMDYYRCASRVGLSRAIEKDCVKEYEDFLECGLERKQGIRYVAMQDQRKKSGRPPLAPPEKDSYHTAP
ncbi:hypothetical protein ScPMuIL_001187 [Solemya velum]